MLTLNLCLLLAFSYIDRCKGSYSNTKEGKVVGGQYGNIVNFPSAVCLNGYCSDNPISYWICGSSILTQRILLTAAHCLDQCEVHGIIHAMAGSNDITRSNTQRRSIADMQIHNQYDPVTMSYDIGLLFLNKNLVYSAMVKRSLIPVVFPDDARATLAGWGVTSERFDTTVKLKYVKQQLQPWQECDKYLKYMPGIFCASSGSATDYPFAGDSGSGLLTPKSLLIGLVSHRTDDNPELTFYTNVSYFYSWIKQNTLQLYCNKKR